MSNPDDPRERFKRPLERPTLNLPSRRKEAPEPAASLPVEVPSPTPAPAAGGLARLLEAIGKMLQPKPQPDPKQAQTPQPAATPSEAPLFTVLVAAMNGDTPDGAASQALYKLLEGKASLKVKPLPRPFQLDVMDDPAQMAAVVTNTRHAVAGENADLLLWGDITKDGYRLRLSTASMPDEERPTTFGPACRLEIPAKLDEPQLNLLYGAILAAAEPANQVQRAGQRRLLPLAAPALEVIAAKPPVAWTMQQQRTAQLVHGHVSAACALVVPPSQAGEWFQRAINAYRAAEKRLNPRSDPAWEAGLMHKYLAAALTARGERLKDRAEEFLAEAVKEWRAAADSISKAAMPQEWAALQTRLGTALYRLDLLTGDTELLREALQALQAALQIHTRAEAPQRWAEVMHTIAQVLEVYGDQLKSPEVLKRAIDACQSVLEVRTRERTPLAWAATRNTLGSALFLLDRHGGGVNHLLQAMEVLQEALEVFTAHGAKGPAQVAARNLAHVKKLAEDRKARQVIDPDWAGR
jgi:tetratricopeptide (TPR) repeat protein